MSNSVDNTAAKNGLLIPSVYGNYDETLQGWDTL